MNWISICTKKVFMSKNSVYVASILVCLVLEGCYTGRTSNLTSWQAGIYQSASSTKIGCLPEEITITDLDLHGGLSRARDWFATCNGQTYFCSGVNDGHGGTTNVSCIKRQKPNNSGDVKAPSQQKSPAKQQTNDDGKTSNMRLVVLENSNVRLTNNSKSKKVTMLNAGEEVEKISESGSWYKVKTANGEIGWVVKKNMKKSE